ncbi:MAG: M23 family metallopeptidase [Deltaproteobacteria bacterium]|nr:M23 family metallopeptidase [Deltaproteobacteria bacterium]
MAQQDVPDEGSPSADPLSRPLPSVNMPLLRGQVRAQRARRMAGLGVVAVAAVGLAAYGIWQWVDAWLDEEPEPEPVASAPVDPSEPLPEEAFEEDTGDDLTVEEEAPEVVEMEPRAPDGATRTATTFGQAMGFRPALLRAGLAAEEAVSIEQALTDVVDFRRCRPDDRIVFERDAEGALLSFEYHDESTSFAKVTHDGEAYTAERVELEVRRERVTRGGTIRSSLGEAVMRAGLDRTHAGLFVEVFDGKVNFSTQARAGDAFRVVLDEEFIEDRRIGYGQVRAIEYVGERAGTMRAFWFETNGRRGDWYGEDGRAIRGGWLRVPCRYDRISSPFDPRRMHPILRRIHPHNGVDFAASTGTPVHAAADGEIIWAGPKGPNGNLISIRHADGYTSHYAHLHRIQRGIRPGVNVEQRQLIGTVGTTGRSTGPHLHFGLKRGGRFVDPMEVINGPGRRLPGGQLGQFRREKAQLIETLESLEVDAPTPAPEAEPREEGPSEAMD